MTQAGWYGPEGSPVPVYRYGDVEESINDRMQLVIDSHLVSMIPRLTDEFAVTKQLWARREFKRARRQAIRRSLLRKAMRGVQHGG